MAHIVCPHCFATNRVPEEKCTANSGAHCCKYKQPFFTGQPIDGTSDNFAKLVHNSDLPVIVDFWAPWCGPCKMFAPAFSQVANQFNGKAVFVKVNTEQQQQLAAQFGIRSIPTLMIFKSGQKVTEMAGAMPAPQFAQWVQQAL